MTWRELATDAGALIDVRASKMTGGFAALAFVFERGTLRLAPHHDSDEIHVAVDDDTEMPAQRAAMLEDLSGMTLEYAWEMRNHRGYLDAFQMRFLDLDSRDERTWQFEVAASIILAREVQDR